MSSRSGGVRSDPSRIATAAASTRPETSSFGEDVADVDADGLLADEQPLPDLAVGPALGDEPEDLALAPAQPERVGPLGGAGGSPAIARTRSDRPLR